jgi:hypothetical protein
MAKPLPREIRHAEYSSPMTKVVNKGAITPNGVVYLIIRNGANAGIFLRESVM